MAILEEAHCDEWPRLEHETTAAKLNLHLHYEYEINNEHATIFGCTIAAFQLWLSSPLKFQITPYKSRHACNLTSTLCDRPKSRYEATNDTLGLKRSMIRRNAKNFSSTAVRHAFQEGPKDCASSPGKAQLRTKFTCPSPARIRGRQERSLREDGRAVMQP